MVYTGAGHKGVDEITLSGTSFGGQEGAIETKVKVIRGDMPGIVGQYVEFCHAADRFRESMGATEQAVRAILTWCVTHDILTEYLNERAEEVIGIMLALYDAQEVQRDYLRAERRDARIAGHDEGFAEGHDEGRKEGHKECIVEGVVATCRALDITAEQAVSIISERLGLSMEQAAEEVRRLWAWRNPRPRACCVSAIRELRIASTTRWGGPSACLPNMACLRAITGGPQALAHAVPQRATRPAVPRHPGLRPIASA